MAQIKFYFNNDEWKELFEYLQISNSSMIPDIFYDVKQYYVISNFEEFIKYQEDETTHFFLINDIFTLEPLLISLNRYTQEPKYEVNQRKGGPYIDISYYRGFTDDAIIPYKATYLSYYPNFIHFNSSNEFNASNELKEYYINMVKFIKKKCKVIQKDNKKHLVGHGVLTEIEPLL